MSNKRKKGQNRPQGGQNRPRNDQQQSGGPKADVIDFDALKPKKRAVLKKIPPVKIAGKEYRLRETFPLAVTEYFAEHAKREEQGGEKNIVVLLDDMQQILRALFGDAQWAEIVQHIDITDVAPLFDAVFKAYGESPGEPGNSGQS